MESRMNGSTTDVDDSGDSCSDILKVDYAEASNCDSQVESGSESQMDFAEMGVRNSGSSGLTMKEYEEQLKKLTAENFNLKLRVYFVEERLSKVTGISDKEDLIKKNIQLKVTCESQLKELEKKQELLFEASKAFELLQKEHTEEVDKLVKDKDKEIADLEEKLSKFEAVYNELASKFPNLGNLNDSDAELKILENFEKQVTLQVSELESNLRDEEDRCRELESMLKDNQLELESYQVKMQRMENELDQRISRIEELVDELEQKEHGLASANFRIRKLEDELKSKEREDDIMKERIEEKNKTIDSLKKSLATKDDNIEVLENRIAKERSSLQTLQSKFDSLSFQNSRLKEEVDIIKSRLRRNAESSSPRGKTRSGEDDVFKQKYEEMVRTLDEVQAQYSKRFKELEEKLYEKDVESEEYQELLEKHKKLEDDHRKACTALKNFIKRSGEDKKEREALNHVLNNQAEVIADLTAQLDQNRSNMARIMQEDKLSLAETGDNDRKFGCTAADKDSCCYEKDKQIETILSKLEKKENLLKEFEKRIMKCNCGVEQKMEKVSELEAEVIVLKHQLEDKNETDSEEKDTTKQVLVNELEMKKCEIEKLNGELKRRNINLQEVVNKELWDKNRQIEKLEKRMAEINELSEAEIMTLNQEINVRDQHLRVFRSKMEELGIPTNTILSEQPLDIDKVGNTLGYSPESITDKSSIENCHAKKTYLARRYDGFEEILKNTVGLESGDKTMECLEKECARAKEQADKADAIRKEAAEVCSLLSVRLEELALFLDSLLTNRELLSGIGLKKRQDIRQAMEKSRELSRSLSLSFAKRNFSDTSLMWNSMESTCGDGLTTALGDSFAQNESLGILMARDKVISEQTVIINRLREQLKILNQEIKQRDIELSHCQGDHNNFFNEEYKINFDDQGIDSQRLSICQEINDEDFEDDEGDEKEEAKDEEKQENFELSRFEKSCRKTLFFTEEKRSPMGRSHETSESEAWSEPDRSVSLARMGKLEEPAISISQRNSKCNDSGESSEETLNENPRSSGKRCRSAESEVRRLQSRIKTLDEANENLRLEIGLLKSGKMDSNFTSRIQKNEEANIVEKLRKTMDRLDECSLTCRQLEEQLAAALERASASAVQLCKAAETISNLEEQITQLREEISIKTTENEEKTRQIMDLESRIQEITTESELKVIEAMKQREAAERKTMEVECRLKDAENMSKEVESRVNEIEKKICETKEFKKETISHFREAERHVDTAEKMMEEAEQMKLEAERKSKDFQSFIDLMRKEVEEKLKDAERRVKKSDREKEELEKQVVKLKKRLMEAEKNKTEVETKVKEGKETIQCMEEKLKELEVAMDQCSEEAQRKIKEMQKKADAKVMELEMKIEEREYLRKTEAEKKMAEAEKISRELEIGFKRQLEDAEKKVKKAKECAEMTILKIREDSKKQEAELKKKIAEIEVQRKEECADLRKQLSVVRLEASEFELELTKLTNEKIHLEEELKRLLDKETALVKDNKEIKGKYENSIHELENKLTQLTLNKSQLASRLEEIESTNIDLVSRISALRGREMMMLEQEFTSVSPSFSPPNSSSLITTLFGDIECEINGNRQFVRQGSAASDPGEQLFGIHSTEGFAGPRRNMNSSPDLGIESDPGRFSSLEANQQTTGDQAGILAKSESSEVKKLECENAELRRRLVRTRQALEETLTQLSAANQRKKQVERAICKQLHKTHHILKKARVNFESQDGDPVE